MAEFDPTSIGAVAVDTPDFDPKSIGAVPIDHEFDPTSIGAIPVQSSPTAARAPESESPLFGTVIDHQQPKIIPDAPQLLPSVAAAASPFEFGSNAVIASGGQPTFSDIHEAGVTPLVDLTPDISPRTAGNIASIADITGIYHGLSAIYGKEHADKLAAGAIQGAGTTASSLLTPENITLAATVGGAPLAVRSAVGAGFLAMMAKAIPEQVMEAANEKDPQTAAKLWTQVGAGAALVGTLGGELGGRHSAVPLVQQDQRQPVADTPWRGGEEPSPLPETEVAPMAEQALRETLSVETAPSPEIAVEGKAPAEEPVAATHDIAPLTKAASEEIASPSATADEPPVNARFQKVVDAEISGLHEAADPVEALDHMEAIEDDAVRAAIAKQYGIDPAGKDPNELNTEIAEKAMEVKDAGSAAPAAPVGDTTSEEEGQPFVDPSREQLPGGGSMKRRMGSEGPGAAAESEFPEQGKVGAYNAAVDAQRAARGLEPLMSRAREANPVTWDAAVDRIEADQSNPERLVEEIHSGEKKSVSKDEQAELLWRMTDLRNKLELESERAVDEHSTPREQADAQTKAEGIERQLQRTEEADRIAGSHSGAALQFRQVLANEDYTFAGLMRRERKARGGAVDAETRTKILEQANQIADLEKKLSEAETEHESEKLSAEKTRIIEATINELGKAYLSAPSFGREVLNIARDIVGRWKKAAEGVDLDKDIKSFLGGESGGVGGVGGGKGGKKLSEARAGQKELISKIALKLRSDIGEFGLKKAEAIADYVGKYGEKVRDLVIKAWDEAHKLIATEKMSDKAREVASKGVGKKGEKTTGDVAARAAAEAKTGVLTSKTAYEAVRSVINSGVRGEKEIGKAALDLLKPHFPDLTENELDVKSTRYGQAKYPNPEENAAALRKQLRLRQMQAAIEDVKKRGKTAKSGVQRDKLDADMRQRQSELRAAIEQYGKETPATPEQLANREAAQIRAKKNAIEDLDRELKTGEEKLKAAKKEQSPAVAQLQAELDAMKGLKQELKDAETPPKSPVENQIEALSKIRNKLDETLQGKRPANAPKDWNPLSGKAEDIQAEVVAMRQLAKELRDAQKPPTDPGSAAEKAQIRALEDAIDRYEQKTKAGDFSTTGKKLGPDSARVSELKAIRDARRDAYDAAKKAGQPVKTPDEIYNERRMTQINKGIEDAKARITAKNFAPKAKPVPKQVFAATAKAAAQLSELKNQIKQGFEEQKFANRSTPKRVIDAGKNVAKFLTGIKVLGHGTVGMFTHAGGVAWRPSRAITFWKNFGRQYGMWASKDFHEQLIYKLKNDPEYADWKQAGASIDPDHTYTDYGLYAKWMGKLGAGGSRGFDALKLIRLELNKADWKSVPATIKMDPTAAMETRKQIAAINNKATGALPRGGKESLNLIARTKAADMMFFAPKLYASRWARVVLDPLTTAKTAFDWNAASPSEKQAAKIRLKHAGEFAAVYAGALLTNQAILKATGSQQNVNMTDPTKSDWLKFKAGGKNIVADGGLLDPVRLIGQVVWGDLIQNRTKQQQYQQGTRYEKATHDMAQYVRGKFNPTLGLVVDSATGSNFQGRPLPFSKEPPRYKDQPAYTWTEWLSQQGPIPISQASQVVYESLREKGMTHAQAMQLMEGAVAAVVGSTGVHESVDYKTAEHSKR